MGRKKDDEVARLEAKVRELKAINRTLVKRLKKVNKGYRKARDDSAKEDTPEDNKPEKPIALTCERCGKGKIQTVQVLNRLWEACDTCDWRGKTEITV